MLFVEPTTFLYVCITKLYPLLWWSFQPHVDHVWPCMFLEISSISLKITSVFSWSYLWNYFPSMHHLKMMSLLHVFHMHYPMVMVKNTQNKFQIALTCGSMDNAIIGMLYENQNFILGPWIFLIITSQKMNQHPFHHHHFPISIRVGGCGSLQFGIELLPQWSGLKPFQSESLLYRIHWCSSCNNPKRYDYKRSRKCIFFF